MSRHVDGKVAHIHDLPFANLVVYKEAQHLTSFVEHHLMYVRVRSIIFRFECGSGRRRKMQTWMTSIMDYS